MIHTQRTRDKKLSTIAIEVRFPRILMEIISEHRRFYGYTPQKTIVSIITDYFRDELNKRLNDEFEKVKEYSKPAE